MKKFLSLLILPIVVVMGFNTFSFAQNQGDNEFTNPVRSSAKNIDLIGTGTGQQDAFVNVVKGAINWILGILGLIALIILLWGGFQMVTASGNEEQYKKGFTILKQAAIGLILIGVAWFVISIIFWLVNLVTTTAGPDAGTA